ncbi:4-demethylwyosine synthase TYW1, partial [Candidatus Woesearchaeota archaeon]|nr:4-demethylwyosine synthase TYW1 [Candidatus Woesearchaeota archaeon]
MIGAELKKLLEKQKYAFIGRHSAVKICSWTKKSLLGDGFCYKQKFYGIKTHRCCQMSPSIGFCSNKCLFCWRPIEYTKGKEIKGEIDSPGDLIKNSVLMQKRQIEGFRGNSKI